MKKYHYRVNKDLGSFHCEFSVFAKNDLDAEDKATQYMLKHFTWDDLEIRGMTYFRIA